MNRYWEQLVASPEDKRRGQALDDAINHLTRAAAALAAAAENHPDPYKGPALTEAYDKARGLTRALRMLA